MCSVPTGDVCVPRKCRRTSIQDELGVLLADITAKQTLVLPSGQFHVSRFLGGSPDSIDARSSMVPTESATVQVRRWPCWGFFDSVSTPGHLLLVGPSPLTAIHLYALILRGLNAKTYLIKAISLESYVTATQSTWTSQPFLFLDAPNTKACFQRYCPPTEPQLPAILSKLLLSASAGHLAPTQLLEPLSKERMRQAHCHRLEGGNRSQSYASSQARLGYVHHYILKRYRILVV